MIMGSGGSHWRPARKRRPYLKQLIKKTPIVGQLFKANSKIALEPEVLEVFVCVFWFCCCFVLRILPRSLGALEQTLHQNEFNERVECKVQQHATLALRWLSEL